MSHTDPRRRLRRLAQALDKGESIDQLEMNFLIESLWQIGNGADANATLGIKSGRGQKVSDLVARRRMSFILHIVECFMFPDPNSDRQDMTLEQACIEVEKDFVAIAKRLYPGADKTKYTAEYIQRCHSSPKYKDMRSPWRRPTDDNSPYAEQIEDFK